MRDHVRRLHWEIGVLVFLLVGHGALIGACLWWSMHVDSLRLPLLGLSAVLGLCGIVYLSMLVPLVRQRRGLSRWWH